MIHMQVIAMCDNEEDTCPKALVVPNEHRLQPFIFLMRQGWDVVEDTENPAHPVTYCAEHKEPK